jgi:hypothetical protein
MAPQVVAHPGTRPTEGRATVDTTILRTTTEEVPIPTDETLHGCYEGFVYIGHEEDGEEVIEAVPCRRCKGEDL